MAYSNSTSDRMDELRFRSQQSPRNDASLLGLVSPPRNGHRVQQPLQQDGRNGLMRRFTTDSSKIPTIASLASQRERNSQEEYGGPPSVSKLLSQNLFIVLDDPTSLPLSFHTNNHCQLCTIALTLAFANYCPPSDVP